MVSFTFVDESDNFQRGATGKRRDGLGSWQSKGNSKLSERVAIPSYTRRMEAAGQ